jgi:hypothetical protein
VKAQNGRTKSRGSQDDAIDAAATTEDGTYELVLWSPGDYVFVASTPAGTPAAVERVTIQAGRNTVDFALAAAAVAGVVVDQEREPIEGVDLVLETSGAQRMARTGRTSRDGTFYFPLEAGGGARLRALKTGYVPQTLELQLDSDVESPRLEIVLTRQPRLEGVLLSAAGMPVTGGWVSVWVPEAGGQARAVGEATTDLEGRFSLPTTSATAVGLASGPGCPLTLFRVATGQAEATVSCAAGLSAMTLVFSDEQQRPYPGARLILVREGFVIPPGALARHQGSLGLATESDAQGRLVLAALAPGDYRAYLAQAANEGLAWLESDQGYLGTFTLPAQGHEEYGVAVEREELPNLTSPGE